MEARCERPTPLRTSMHPSIRRPTRSIARRQRKRREPSSRRGRPATTTSIPDAHQAGAHNPCAASRRTSCAAPARSRHHHVHHAERAYTATYRSLRPSNGSTATARASVPPASCSTTWSRRLSTARTLRRPSSTRGSQASKPSSRRPGLRLSATKGLRRLRTDAASASGRSSTSIERASCSRGTAPSSTSTRCWPRRRPYERDNEQAPRLRIRHRGGGARVLGGAPWCDAAGVPTRRCVFERVGSFGRRHAQAGDAVPVVR